MVRAITAMDTNYVVRLLALAVVLLRPVTALAVTAASPSFTDVQTAVNAATNGEAVIIPAGTATWTTTMTVTKPLAFVGAGTNSTYITINVSNPGGNPGSGGLVLQGYGYNQVSGITFKGLGGNTAEPALTCWSGAAVRVYNCAFVNCWGGINISGPFGVVDHNSFLNNRGSIKVNGWDNGQTNWTTYYPIAFSSTNYLFVESNAFGFDTNFMTGSFGSAAALVSAGQGASYVARYNTISVAGSVALGPAFDWHGDNNDATRGTLSVQVYKNNFTFVGVADMYKLCDARGGQSLVYSNVVTAPAGYAAGAVDVREEYPSGTIVSGTTYFDANTNVFVWANTYNGAAIGVFCDQNCSMVSYTNAAYGGAYTQAFPHSLVTTSPPPATLVAVPPIQHNQYDTNVVGQPFTQPATYNGTLTVNGLFSTTNNINGALNPCAAPFNATGDGQTDDSDALQNAINFASTNRNVVKLPPLTFAIGKPITLPAWSALVGTVMDTGYKGSIPRRSVIKTLGDFTALQTPRLTYPNDTMAWWASQITVADLYVVGPGLQGTIGPASTSVGIDMTGVYDSVLKNVHAEGFGTGILRRNTADNSAYDLFAQNNYIGLRDSRKADPTNVYDCVTATFNAISINNMISVVLDNPRSSVWYGGTFNSNTNLPQVLVTNCWADVLIKIDGVLMENHSSTYGMITVDTNGVGNLICNGLTLETDQGLPLIDCAGYFDRLQLTESSIERYLPRTGPLVWARRPTVSNQFYKRNVIQVERNTPSWFDAWVRNDQPGESPLHDYVPNGFVGLNPNPATDHSGDGIVLAGGDYAWGLTNVLAGNTRIAWRSDRTNNSYGLYLSTNYTRGIDQIYVTYTLYDDGNTNRPASVPFGWGTQGPGWSRVAQGLIGQFTNAAGIVFSKFCDTLQTVDSSVSRTDPLNRVTLMNIYGTTTNQANYGLEQFNVYAPAQKNRGVALAVNPVRMMNAAPNPLQGYFKQGDCILNDMTLVTNVYGWNCFASGIPGSWEPSVRLRALPNLFGTLTPGPNVASNYWSGYGGFNTWPMAAGTIYDAGTTDQYLVFDGVMNGASTRISQLWDGANSGGAYLESHYDTTTGKNWFDIGTFYNGTAQPGTVQIRVLSNAVQILSPIQSAAPIYAPQVVASNSMTLNGSTITNWPSGGGAALAGTVVTNGGVATGDIMAFGNVITNATKATAANITNAIGAALDARYPVTSTVVLTNFFQAARRTVVTGTNGLPTNSIAQYPWPLPLTPNVPLSSSPAYVDTSAADVKLVLSNGWQVVWQDITPGNYGTNFTVHIIGNMETGTTVSLSLTAELWPMLAGVNNGTANFATVNSGTFTSPGSARFQFPCVITCANTGGLIADTPYQLRITMTGPTAQLFNITRIYVSWDPK